MERFLQIDIKTILSLEKSKRQRNFMARHMILKSEHQMQRLSKGRHSATVCYAITCDSSISYGCWLLYFRFSCLWMHLGKQWEVAHVLGPMPHTWENGWNSWLLSSLAWLSFTGCSQNLGTEPATEKYLPSLCLHPPSYYAFQRN